ncbi:hypothetical protein STEG23_013254, partial [Scotinomys teguina]
MDNGKPGQMSIIRKEGPRNIGNYSVSCSKTYVSFQLEDATSVYAHKSLKTSNDIQLQSPRLQIESGRTNSGDTNRINKKTKDNFNNTGDKHVHPIELVVFVMYQGTINNRKFLMAQSETALLGNALASENLCCQASTLSTLPTLLFIPSGPYNFLNVEVMESSNQNTPSTHDVLVSSALPGILK